MAYISTENVAQIRQTLKQRFPNLRFNVCKESGGLAVRVRIVSGDVDFSDILETGHIQVNPYYLHQYGQHEALFEQIIEVIKTSSSKQYYDRSDAMTDYFDTAFYYHLEVGSWRKAYALRTSKQHAESK